MHGEYYTSASCVDKTLNSGRLRVLFWLWNKCGRFARAGDHALKLEGCMYTIWSDDGTETRIETKEWHYPPLLYKQKPRRRLYSAYTSSKAGASPGPKI